MLKFCPRSARLLLIFAPLLVTACASPVQITQGGRNVQIISDRNMHYMNCKKAGPINETVDAVAPAQVVYDAAVSKARNKAAEMGADSLVMFDADHFISGLANIVTVHGVALKCY